MKQVGDLQHSALLHPQFILIIHFEGATCQHCWKDMETEQNKAETEQNKAAAEQLHKLSEDCNITHQSELGMWKCTALDVTNLFQSFFLGILNSTVFS